MIIRSIILFLFLILLWQLFVFIFDLPPYLLPSPVLVWQSLMNHLSLLLKESLPTLFETLLGFLLGISAGLMGGILIANYGLLRFWFFPLLIISQAIPTFAIAPLFVLWFGYGLSSKILVTILMIFFPVTSAFYDGLMQTPKPMLDLARIENGTPLRILWYIRLPAALPRLASGIRIAAVIAPMGAIIGEWVGSAHGLGYIMLTANAQMEIDLLFAALCIVIIMALTLYFIVDLLLKKYIWWNL